MLKRWGAVQVLIGGAFIASLLMALTGFFSETPLLLLQRLLAGVRQCGGICLWWFVGGAGLARIGLRSRVCCWVFITAAPVGALRLSALFWFLLALSAANEQALAHPWAWAWWGLAFACFTMTLVLVRHPLAYEALDGMSWRSLLPK